VHLNYIDKTDSAYFASSASDRTDWDALMHRIANSHGMDFNNCISIDDNTAVAEFSTDCDIVAAESLAML
jgi:hypothetical protein